MTVTLNEVALKALLESENGPIGRDLRRRAENVTARAEQNASGPIIGIRTGNLHSGIRYEIQDGPVATIGTDANKRGFFYPAFWDRSGRPWLTEALREGFNA